MLVNRKKKQKKQAKTTTTQAPPLEALPGEKPKKLTAAEKAQTILSEAPVLTGYMRLETSLMGPHYNAMLSPTDALSNLMGLMNSLCTRTIAYLDNMSKFLAPQDANERAIASGEIEKLRWAAGMRIQSLTPSAAMLLAARDRLATEYYERGPQEEEDSPIVFPKQLDREHWTLDVVRLKGKTALPAPPAKTHAQETNPRASAGTGSKKPI